MKEQVKKTGYDDFLKVGDKGQIFEASTSNIFFTIGDRIYYPLNNEKKPYLDGITISNLRKEYLFRKDIFLDDIKKFEYCFLTNSVDYLVSVESIDEVEFKKADAKSKKYWLRKTLFIK